MKKLAVLLFVMIACATCDKVPINGQLDGMWQIMNIQTPQGVRNVKRDRAYLSFQLHLTQWDYNGRRYYAHFTHAGDSLCFFDFSGLSQHSSEADDDPEITPADMASGLFDVYGIHTVDARFRVVELGRSSLILESADTTLTFRKF